MNSCNVRTINMECENAMIDRTFHEEVITWIQAHQTLFTKAALLIKENDLMNKYESLKSNNDYVFIFKFYNTFLVNDIN
jgi:hypothetical protein